MKNLLFLYLLFNATLSFCQSPIVDFNNDSNILEIDGSEFISKQKGKLYSVKGNISKSSNVSLKLKNPNLFKYKFEFGVNETYYESLNLLDGYFSTFFDLFNGLVGTSGEESTVYKDLIDYQLALLKIQEELNEFYTQVPEDLFISDFGELDAKSVSLKSSMQKIVESRKDILESIKDQDETIISDLLLLFNSFQEGHNKITEAISKIDVTLNNCKNGLTHYIGKKKAGTLVSVNIKPVHLGGQEVATEKYINFEYLSGSGPKFKYGVGIAYSGLDDIELEQLQNLSGTSAFLITKKEDESIDLTAFVTYNFISFDSKNNYNLGFTLGTNFLNPGEHIYSGFTFNFAETFNISGGVSFAPNNVSLPDLQQLSNVGETVNAFKKELKLAGYLAAFLSF